MATSSTGVRVTRETLTGFLTIYSQGLRPAALDGLAETAVKATQIMMGAMEYETTKTGRLRVSAGRGSFAGRIRRGKNQGMYSAIALRGKDVSRTLAVRENRNGNLKVTFGALRAPAYFKYQEYGTKRGGPVSLIETGLSSYKKDSRGGIPEMAAFQRSWAYFGSRMQFGIAAKIQEMGDMAAAGRRFRSAFKTGGGAGETSYTTVRFKPKGW